MDDLLKKLTEQGGQASGKSHRGNDPLGGLGGMLGSGGLGNVLGGAAGGGLGASAGGPLGGLLGGALGALLPALLGMLGSRASSGQSGLHQLLDGMHAQGAGDVADSWVGTGANRPVSPGQVEQALGADKVQQLASQSGLPPDQVSQGLAAILPGVVDHLTPEGQVPSPDHVQQEVGGLLGSRPSG